MTLFDEIKKYAKLRGMNIKQTAIKAGLSENAIYGWKTHTPTAATINAVAKVLGVTYAQLTGEEESTEPTTIDLKAAAESDDVILSYDGRPIPAEDLEIIKRLLRRD